MQRFPHHYSVTLVEAPTGPATVSSPALPDLTVDAPPEFDGPGGLWSPETLLMAAVANCFATTWRAVASVNHFEWVDLKLDATGVLDRVDRVTQFTQVHLTVHLAVPAGTDPEQAEKLVHKTEAACLITNSLTAESTFELHLAQG